MNYKIIFLWTIGILLSITLIHFAYMKATSYTCIKELPPKPFINETTGEEFYYGIDKLDYETKCKGGILAKFPID